MESINSDIFQILQEYLQCEDIIKLKFSCKTLNNIIKSTPYKKNVVYSWEYSSKEYVFKKNKITISPIENYIINYSNFNIQRYFIVQRPYLLACLIAISSPYRVNIIVNNSVKKYITGYLIWMNYPIKNNIKIYTNHNFVYDDPNVLNIFVNSLYHSNNIKDFICLMSVYSRINFYEEPEFSLYYKYYQSCYSNQKISIIDNLDLHNSQCTFLSHHLEWFEELHINTNFVFELLSNEIPFIYSPKYKNFINNFTEFYGDIIIISSGVFTYPLYDLLKFLIRIYKNTSKPLYFYCSHEKDYIISEIIKEMLIYNTSIDIDNSMYIINVSHILDFIYKYYPVYVYLKKDLVNFNTSDIIKYLFTLLELN